MIDLGNDIFFSSATKDMDLEVIFKFVSNSYWGKSRTMEEQKIAIENTMNFGLFYKNRQIAYTRVMTDKVFFAYLLDVFVVEEFQNRGFGKLLMKNILNFPTLKHIDKWILATKNAHSFYEKFGFEAVRDPSKLMDKMSERAKKIYE